MWYLYPLCIPRTFLGTRVENHSQNQYQPVHDLCIPPTAGWDRKRGGSQCKQTDHDEGIRDASDRVKVALEDEREDREQSTEKIDGHEGERDTDDRAKPIYLVILGSARARTQLSNMLPPDGGGTKLTRERERGAPSSRSPRSEHRL